MNVEIYPFDEAIQRFESDIRIDTKQTEFTGLLD